MHNYIYGIHSINLLLQKSPERILEIFILKDRKDQRLQKIIEQINLLGLKIQFVNRTTLDKKSNQENHQGIIVAIKTEKEFNENDLALLLEKNSKPFLLILDGVTDPHNLGACLRSADAAGVDAIIVPKNNAASLTGTVRKVACGAAETVPLIRVTNLARTLQYLKDKNIWIVGTAGEANDSIYQARLSGAIALVMGAEETGMRRLTRENCDLLVKIPLMGSVSSLNVSVASGICLFEILRQRKFIINE